MAVSQSLSVTEVAGSVNEKNNTSQVKIKWTSTQTGDSWNGYERTAYYWVRINGGAETKYSVSYTLPLSTTKTIVERTITVTHKTDGSGTVSVRTWMDTDISAGVVEKSASVTLTTINRKATITSAPNFNDNSNPTIYYSNPIGSGVYALQACISLTGDLADISYRDIGKIGTSYTFNLTDDERTVLRNATTGNPPSRTVKFIIRTKLTSSSSWERDSLHSTFTVQETEATRPVDAISVSPVSTLPSAFSGLYVQGKTKISISHSASFKFAATASRYTATIDNKTYSGVSVTSDFINTAGIVSVKGYVRDSRGFTSAVVTEDITVQPYFKPYVSPVYGLSNIICTRCTEDGTASPSGTRLLVKCARNYAGIVGINQCELKLRYKKETDISYSEKILLSKTDTVNTYDGVVSGIELSVSSVYNIQIEAIDDISDPIPVNFAIPTDVVPLHLGEGGKNVGIGRYANMESPGRLDVAWDSFFEKNVQVDGALKAGTLETTGAATFGGNVSGEWLSGTWLRSTAHSDLGAAPESYPVFQDGWLYSRTLAEMRADLAAYETVPLTVVSDRLTDLSYTARYYPMLGMCFVRIYGKINADLNTGYDYDLLNVGSHVPNYVTALSIKCGKNVMASAKSNGVINIRPIGENIAASAGWAVYISGFWFA